jgi:hypothetical protein
MAAQQTAHRVSTTNSTYYVLTTIRTRGEYMPDDCESRVWGPNGRFFHADRRQDLKVGQTLQGECGTARVFTSTIRKVERISMKEFDRATD